MKYSNRLENNKGNTIRYWNYLDVFFYVTKNVYTDKKSSGNGFIAFIMALLSAMKNKNLSP